MESNMMKKFMISLLTIGMLSLAATTGSNAGSRSVTVAFGDSNTAGANWVKNGYDPAEKWVNKLQLLRPMINSGVAGNTTGMAKTRVKALLDQNPKTILIMFGTNDGVLNKNFIPKTSRKQFEIDLSYLVDTFRVNGTNVVLMTALPIIEEGNGYFYSRNDKNLYPKYGGARKFQDTYNDITRKVAREKDVPLVDTYRIFLRYAGNVETDESFINSGLIDQSGTHMTMFGSEVLYRAVKTTLKIYNY
jgi:lysophospholipase L1-like esterase